MKNLLFIILVLITVRIAVAQQTYCDWEGTQVMKFGPSSGVLDSLLGNPFPVNSIDSSEHCAKYIRDTTIWDNIKLYTNKKLADVTPYMDNSSTAPKIKMKVYSSGPVGTVVQLQLGIKSVDVYPEGIHSEYIAVSTVQNAWEELTFNFLQATPGSLVSAINIDKVVILFNPNSSARDTMYFDDLIGPPLIDYAGIHENTVSASLKLYQNSPNPAKEITHIDFQLSTPGKVSLKLYDILGNSIASLLDQNMKAGNYSMPVETASIPNGIYFYVLTKEGDSRSIKMVVSK